MVRDAGVRDAGVVVWLTGISGSGKTTLGRLLIATLRERGHDAELIDGDVVREFFERDLGYTRAERIANVKRIAFAAMLLAEHGVHVVVANIAPYVEVREFIRKRLTNYVQIYLRVPLETAMMRDVQGHYERFRKGEERNLIGVDDAYELPRNPDLVIDTAREAPEESLGRIMEYLKTRGCV